MFTEWFYSNCGVRQGDILSPTLFNIFINELVVELNMLKLGLKQGGTHICILLYAYDMVLLCDEKSQKMLDHLDTSCTEWHFSINNVKWCCAVVKETKDRPKHIFRIGAKVIETVSS